MKSFELIVRPRLGYNTCKRTKAVSHSDNHPNGCEYVYTRRYKHLAELSEARE